VHGWLVAELAGRRNGHHEAEPGNGRDSTGM
jgi:hypothetical protein